MKNLFNRFIFIFFLCFYCIFSNFSVFAYTNVPINETTEKQNMPLNEDTEKQNISNNADITKQSSSTIPTTGSATVIENNKKLPAEREFFTIETLEGNIFYIVIDKERIQDNVYFLSPVTEEELLSLTKTNTAKTNDTKENQKLEQQILQKLLSKNKETENQQLEPATEIKEDAPKIEQQEIPKKEKKHGILSNLFMLILALIIFGAIYYIKIFKPKHSTDDYIDDDNFEIEDETEDTNGEEIEEIQQDNNFDEK